MNRSPLSEHYDDTAFINSVADWLGEYAHLYDLYASAQKLHAMCLAALIDTEKRYLDTVSPYAYLAREEEAIDRCFASDAWHVSAEEAS